MTGMQRSVTTGTGTGSTQTGEIHGGSQVGRAHLPEAQKMRIDSRRPVFQVPGSTGGGGAVTYSPSNAEATKVWAQGTSTRISDLVTKIMGNGEPLADPYKKSKKDKPESATAASKPVNEDSDLISSKDTSKHNSAATTTNPTNAHQMFKGNIGTAFELVISQSTDRKSTDIILKSNSEFCTGEFKLSLQGDASANKPREFDDILNTFVKSLQSNSNDTEKQIEAIQQAKRQSQKLGLSITESNVTLNREAFEKFSAVATAYNKQVQQFNNDPSNSGMQLASVSISDISPKGISLKDFLQQRWSIKLIDSDRKQSQWDSIAISGDSNGIYASFVARGNSARIDFQIGMADQSSHILFEQVNRYVQHMNEDVLSSSESGRLALVNSKLVSELLSGRPDKPAFKLLSINNLDFPNLKIDGVDFTDAKINNCGFQGCTITGALKRAEFNNCSIEDTTLELTNGGPIFRGRKTQTKAMTLIGDASNMVVGPECGTMRGTKAIDVKNFTNIDLGVNGSKKMFMRRFGEITLRTNERFTADVALLKAGLASRPADLKAYEKYLAKYGRVGEVTSEFAYNNYNRLAVLLEQTIKTGALSKYANTSGKAITELLEVIPKTSNRFEGAKRFTLDTGNDRILVEISDKGTPQSLISSQVRITRYERDDKGRWLCYGNSGIIDDPSDARAALIAILSPKSLYGNVSTEKTLQFLDNVLGNRPIATLRPEQPKNSILNGFLKLFRPSTYFGNRTTGESASVSETHVATEEATTPDTDASTSSAANAANVNSSTSSTEETESAARPKNWRESFINAVDKGVKGLVSVTSSIFGRLFGGSNNSTLNIVGTSTASGAAAPDVVATASAATTNPNGASEAVQSSQNADALENTNTSEPTGDKVAGAATTDLKSEEETGVEFVDTSKAADAVTPDTTAGKEIEEPASEGDIVFLNKTAEQVVTGEKAEDPAVVKVDNVKPAEAPAQTQVVAVVNTSDELASSALPPVDVSAAREITQVELKEALVEKEFLGEKLTNTLFKGTNSELRSMIRKFVNAAIEQDIGLQDAAIYSKQLGTRSDWDNVLYSKLVKNRYFDFFEPIDGDKIKPGPKLITFIEEGLRKDRNSRFEQLLSKSAPQDIDAASEGATAATQNDEFDNSHTMSAADVERYFSDSPFVDREIGNNILAKYFVEEALKQGVKIADVKMSFDMLIKDPELANHVNDISPNSQKDPNGLFVEDEEGIKLGRVLLDYVTNKFENDEKYSRLVESKSPESAAATENGTTSAAQNGADTTAATMDLSNSPEQKKFYLSLKRAAELYKKASPELRDMILKFVNTAVREGKKIAEVVFPFNELCTDNQYKRAIAAHPINSKDQEYFIPVDGGLVKAGPKLISYIHAGLGRDEKKRFAQLLNTKGTRAERTTGAAASEGSNSASPESSTPTPPETTAPVADKTVPPVEEKKADTQSTEKSVKELFVEAEARAKHYRHAVTVIRELSKTSWLHADGLLENETGVTAEKLNKAASKYPIIVDRVATEIDKLTTAQAQIAADLGKDGTSIKPEVVKSGGSAVRGAVFPDYLYNKDAEGKNRVDNIISLDELKNKFRDQAALMGGYPTTDRLGREVYAMSNGCNIIIEAHQIIFDYGDKTLRYEHKSFGRVSVFESKDGGREHYIGAAYTDQAMLRAELYLENPDKGGFKRQKNSVQEYFVSEKIINSSSLKDKVTVEVIDGSVNTSGAHDNSTATEEVVDIRLSNNASAELQRFKDLASQDDNYASLDFGLPAIDFSAAYELADAGIIAFEVDPDGTVGMMRPTEKGKTFIRSLRA